MEGGREVFMHLTVNQDYVVSITTLPAMRTQTWVSRKKPKMYIWLARVFNSMKLFYLAVRTH